MSFSQAIGTGAKASLTSKAPMSSMLRPDFFRAFWVAGIGAVSMITGSAPASVAVCTLASGLRPRLLAFSADMISNAAEPSEIWLELPAWITPSSLNAGLIFAIDSTVPPRRMPPSSSTTVSLPSASLVLMPTIWSLKAPASCAAAAFSCDRRENSSSWVRLKPHCSAIISAPTPWFGVLL